ncbi:MAG: hypothetical protein N2690_04620 [Rhodocyclaceae bacterium]|nr:hypothetical protein [Rhodocyclaceae bacterium]
MNYYFDTRHGVIGIVATDAPEEGMIKVKKGQSLLAARYALVDGEIVDRFPGKSDEEVLAALSSGASQDSAPAPRPISKLAFMERFTDAELAAIYQAAKEDVRVEVWMDKLKLAAEVDLADARTRAGVEALESFGLIGKGRVEEILA